MAEKALPFAEGLAAKFDAVLVLLGIEGSIADESAIPASQLETIKASTLGYLEQKAAIIRKKGIKVNAEFRIDEPAWGIVDYARTNYTDLIVIATHGRSGLRRWVLGSTADRVLRATEKPVLLIRAKEGGPDAIEKRTLSRIIVPLDGSAEAEEILPHVEGLADRFPVEVILLQVITNKTYLEPSADGMAYRYEDSTEEMIVNRKMHAEDYLGTIKERLEAQGIQTTIMVVASDAGSGIIDTAQQTNADLVAMTTHGRSGIKRWVYGSVADKVLHAGTTPLLLVRTAL